MNADPSQFQILPPSEGAPPAQVLRLRTPKGVLCYAYCHERAAVAATVVVHDVRRRAVLLIRRANDPFAGCYAFPGGFLDPGRETVEQTAARELFEETGVRIDSAQLRLVDIRSAPSRDPRDHVLDIGYYARVESAQAKAGDETSEVRWASPREVDSLSLAFDHAELWRSVQSMMNGEQSSQPPAVTDPRP